jgi:hypothetical protein
MRLNVVLCAVLILSYPALAQKARRAPPTPTEFEIGRRTFFDFGPPFNYYEILVVRPVAEGTSVERIMLTPPGIKCVVPAKVEIATASLKESVASLLKTNPCAIPEKELRRERKRCKKCLTFSGAEVTMQVKCGSERRLLRSSVLERDWFDSRANTPEHTSWSMNLLGRLDGVLGPGVMDKPVFPASDKFDGDVAIDHSLSVSEQDVAAGAYDLLFPGAYDKPSELYREAHKPLPSPVITLQSSFPTSPETFVAPEYSPLAKLVKFRGYVSFDVDVDREGTPSNFRFGEGPVFLRANVETAVLQWRFPKSAVDYQVQGVISFTPGCPAN